MEDVLRGRKQSPDAPSEVETGSSALDPIVRNLVLQSPISTFVVDRRDRVVFVNSACRALFRLESDSTADGAAGILEDDELRRHGVLSKIESVFRDGNQITAGHEYDTKEIPRQAHLPVVHKYLRARIFPVRGASGEVDYVVVQHEDRTESRKMREALKKSEANYHAIFNAANDAIFLHNAKTGGILDVNQRMCDMYGYTVEEARKVSVQDLSAGTPPFTQVEGLNWVRKAVEGEPQLFEWRARHKDGHLFWVEVNLKRTVIGGRTRLLAVVRDITERKESEEARCRMEEHFEDQRKQFYRQTILAATGGKLVICDEEEIDAAGGVPVVSQTLVTSADAGTARHRIEGAAEQLGVSRKMAENFALCVGEAATNALKHAGGGEVALYSSPGRLLARITDRGSGMDALILPRATLELGYSSGESLGMGYAVILALADRVLLHTGPTGTSVVIEMDLVTAEAAALDALPDTW